MALSNATVLEVRSTGADTNGGGFVTGQSGTDWSQQNAAQYSVVDGVTAGTTTITSATANFGTDVVGNLIYVTGGTGAVVAAWYQITARGSATSITVDRSTGLTAGTGATLKIGGAFATIAPALAIMTVSGMLAYVKATATYSISTGLTFPAFSAITGAPRLIGYTTTRTDKGRVTIQATAAITMVTLPNSFGNGIENFILDGNSTATVGLLISGTYSNFAANCQIHHCTAEGINDTSSNNKITHCEVYNCAGTSGAITLGGNSQAMYCYSHTNTKSGFSGVALTAFINCVSASNTGASSHGFDLANFCVSVVNCVAYGNGGSGIYSSYGSYLYKQIMNNICVNNTAFGLVLTMSPLLYDPNVDYNAFYNNTSGARSGAGTGAGDVTLTGDPFTNAATGDFSLNTTAGAGAAARSVGFPGVSLFGTGYADIGALRHQDPAGGGGGLLTNPGMSGGMRN